MAETIYHVESWNSFAALGEPGLTLQQGYAGRLSSFSGGTATVESPGPYSGAKYFSGHNDANPGQYFNATTTIALPMPRRTTVRVGLWVLRQQGGQLIKFFDWGGFTLGSVDFDAGGYLFYTPTDTDDPSGATAWSNIAVPIGVLTHVQVRLVPYYDSGGPQLGECSFKIGGFAADAGATTGLRTSARHFGATFPGANKFQLIANAGTKLGPFDIGDGGGPFLPVTAWRGTFPNADNVNQMVALGGGAHYLEVDDGAAPGGTDEDASYVGDDVTGHEETFGFESTGLPGATQAVGLHLWRRGRRGTAVGSRGGQSKIVSGASSALGLQLPLGESYSWDHDHFGDDPATSAAWADLAAMEAAKGGVVNV